MKTAIVQAGNFMVDKIISYYDSTWIDYRAVWLDKDNQAFHFGYWEPQIQTHGDALLNANRILADLAGIQPGHRVLDAGCAHGGTSFWLATERQAEVEGITLVPRQAEHATQEAHRRGLNGQVNFTVADYRNTQMEAGSFDAVIALESLCHAPDKVNFYREAARLLRPGGRLVIADYMRSRRPLSPEMEQICHEWLDGWAIEDIDTMEEHARNAEESGLSSVIVRDGTHWTRRSLRRLHRTSLFAWYPDLILSKLGLRTPTQRGNVVASRRQWQALRGHAWQYGVLTATKPEHV
jgi:cyclopropane fatty-acyl-phospholipid synthase-like methyltransferase